MVGIVTGSGFGLERSSGSVLGDSGLVGGGLQGTGGEGVFVNAATGNLVLQKQDEFLAGLGGDLGISRTYNSLTTLGDDNNDRWRQSTDRRVYGLTGTLGTAGSTVKRVSGDGTETTYSWDASRSAYVTTAGTGAYDTITNSGSQWVWTDGDSQAVERYAYDSTGRIASATDRNGNQLTFSYDGSGRLSQVTDANGEWVKYEWSGTSNNIADILTGYTDLATSTAKTLTRTRYGYDGSNRLTSVTTDLTPGDNSVSDGASYVTTYGYDGSGRVNSITQSDGSSLAITYDGSGRVSTLVQTVSTGVTRTTTLTYNTGYTTVTDPSGQVTRLDYDASGQLTRITAPPAYSGAAQQVVQFAYNANGDVTSVTEGAGNSGGVDQNRFYNSDFAGTGGWDLSNSPDVTSVTTGVSGGVGYLQATMNGSQSYSGINFVTSPQYRVGVTAGEVLSVQAGISYSGSIGVGYLFAFFYDANGNVISQPSVGWVGGQNAAFNTRTGSLVTVPAGAVSMGLQVSGGYGTGVGTLTLSQPMVALASQAEINANSLPAYASGTYYGPGGGGSASTTSYSNFTSNGLAQTVTDRLGNTTTRTFSSANLLLSETRTGVDATGSAVSETTRYVYNSAGNLRFVISPQGRVTEYTLTSTGLVSEETGYTQASYTTAGTPSEATWRAG